MSDSTIKVESGGTYGGNMARISINEREIGYDKYSRGINIAVIDSSTGQPLTATTFDTFAQGTSEALVEFIQHLPVGQIVALAVKEDANYSLSAEAKKAFESLGSTKIQILPTVGSWGLIGKKGETPGQATEEVSYGPVTQSRSVSISEAGSNKGAIAVTSGGGDRASLTQITLNGTAVAIAGGLQRGLNVAVFDEKAGTLLIGRSFDLLANPGNADAFAKMIEDLPEGRIVAIAAKDEASINFSDRAKKACEGLGSRLIRQLGFRGEWALVGFKGAFGSKAIENLNNQGKDWGSAPVSVKFWIPSKAPISESAILPPITDMKLKHKLQPAELQGSDEFGYSVDISGDWAIVGARLADAPESKYNAGAAYIFHWENGQWVQKQKLQPDNLARDDHFGYSVAISGNSAIVGARYADASGKADAGAAYIFQLESGQWVQKQKLQPTDLLANDNFGYSVDISGNWAIVGAYTADIPGFVDAGAAYIFQLENGEWKQKQRLQAADYQAAAYFGQSVAIGENWAMVGAHYVHTPFSYAGAVYTFQYENNQWLQTQKLCPTTPTANAFHFGWSVAISGNWAIFGRPHTYRESVVYTGAAYFFQLENGQWKQKQMLQPADLKASDYFGWSVAISGNWAIAGAYIADTPALPDAGAAYIFQLENGEWKQKHKLQPADLGRSDYFGTSVGLSGNMAIVGANYSEAAAILDAGAAYLFEAQG